MGSTGRPTLASFLRPFQIGSAVLKTQSVHIPANDTANAEFEFPVFIAPGRVEIRDIVLVPDVDLVNNNSATNGQAIAIVNKGTNGAGTTVIGTAINTKVNNTTKRLSKNEYNSYSSAALVVPEKTVLTFRKTVEASGQASPAYLVILYYADLLDVPVRRTN